ncbi:RDD family protein [Psychrobacter sp. I-STPA6b]|uniref:RDD family protein n=1 Tax=Psychrobacter sp. I-STPA6b TaxID=2585718 RepID=UPI001D0C66EC|nr:RDD family protein [Psychrobacter sp. I-STPA6b]
MQIYLARNNVQAGPYSLEQLNNMLASGEVVLSDLMWHEGMENWQRVGTMTNETFYYNPEGHVAPNIQPQPSTETQEQRSRIERLYPQNAQNKISIKKQELRPEETHQIATIGSRILAVIIDQLLAFSCLVPLLSGIGFDLMRLIEASTDYTAFSQIIESIPSHLVLMTTLMLLALMAIQVTMLIKRGQTLGKLAMGIQILDFDTKKIPNVTNIILIRTVLTNIAYNLPYIGILILLADFSVMVSDKQRRSIHDKVAKTYVVKATADSQRQLEQA